MYFWKTRRLAGEIKNNSLTDNDWKNYYLSATVLGCFCLYLSMFSPRANQIAVAVEMVMSIIIIIFGVRLTYGTNQQGSGSNYVARVTALGFPVLIKIFLLGFLYGFIVAFVNYFHPISPTMQEWNLTFVSIITQIIFFWRINVHLKFINS